MLLLLLPVNATDTATSISTIIVEAAVAAIIVRMVERRRMGITTVVMLHSALIVLNSSAGGEMRAASAGAATGGVFLVDVANSQCSIVKGSHVVITIRMVMMTMMVSVLVVGGRRSR